MIHSKIHCTYTPEQKLIFSSNIPFMDQKTGLSLYGPYSSYPKQITIGIIGGNESVDQVRRLLQICRTGTEGAINNPLWTPPFPGFKKVFDCEIIDKQEWHSDTITESDIQSLEKLPSYRERIGRAVDIFVEKISNLKEREGSPLVFICAPPLAMMNLCIPPEGEFRTGKKGQKSSYEKKWKSKEGHPGYHPMQQTLLGFDPKLKELNQAIKEQRAADNFHHFLKGKVMKLAQDMKTEIPTQFMRPFTLEKIFDPDKGKVQDMATICWNICTALFYKAGGRPWRLEHIPVGTCFIGITFYREKAELGGQIGTSLAQVFTPEGEGLVVRGERITWEKYKEPHLSKDASKRLMKKILESYTKQTKTTPTRIVIHKSSTFNDDERAGLKEEMPEKCRYDFVTIKSDRSQKPIKFFRQGYHPAIRGTTVVLSKKNRLLYSRGYVPFLKIYPGPRVPRPIEIIFDETDSSHDQLCSEIIGLTRMNMNSADFACNFPITLQFSRWVGSILRELPPGTIPAEKILYYM